MLSIIIPIYNMEKYIEGCIRNIISKYNRRYELILINDGSTDNSLKLCYELQKNYKFIKVIDKKNGGVSSARNSGIVVATGEWIVFVDVDDVLEIDVTHVIEKCDDDIDFIMYSKMHLKDCVLNLSDEKVFDELVLGIMGFPSSRYRNTFLKTVTSKVYKADIIRNNNIRFSEGMINGEDILFNIEYLFCVNKVLLKKECGYKYRVHQGSATKKFQKNIIKNDELFLNKLNELMLNKGKIQLLEPYLYILSLNGIWICLSKCIGHYKNEDCLNEKITQVNNLIYTFPYNKAISNLNKYSIMFSKSKRIVFSCLKNRMYSIVLLFFYFASRRTESICNEKLIEV